LVAPPIGAALWWLSSRGWAGAIQGGAVSEKTRVRQRYGFWVVLGVIYVIMFATTAYCNLRPSQ
jgi:hypothetical protein